MTEAETTHERVGSQSVLHRRVFDAPPSAVHRAHVDPDWFQHWMGPRGTTVRIERWSAVSGGAFAYTVVAGDARFSFRGSYHEVSPDGILHTWQYVGELDVTLEALAFLPLPDGGCLLEVTSTYQSEAACDAMIASGLDDGMTENFSRLDELLARHRA